MTIYVSGGSNSVMKDSWVPRFAAHHPDVVNISIGHASSIMGAYRAMFCAGMQAGDTLVWEYALNDANHVRRGHSADYLLRFVEHIIVHCRTLGVRFAPVIFTHLRDELPRKQSPYHRALHALLQAYGLAAFDMSIEYRRALGVDILPRECFGEPAHYAHDDEIVGFITDGATRAVAAARVPDKTMPLRVGNRRLRLLDGFATTKFHNSLLDLTAALPPVTQTFDHDGELAALIVMTTAKASTFNVNLAGQVVEMSATHPMKSFAKPLLKAFSCQRALGRPWQFAAQDALVLTQSATCDPAYAEVGCEKHLEDPLQDPKSMLVGILTEA